MTCGIYLITNNISQRKYVGASGNIEKRWTSHLNQSRLGNKKSELYDDMRTEGIKSFTFSILEICGEDKLTENERKWVLALNALRPNGYNIQLPNNMVELAKEPRRQSKLCEIHNRMYYVETGGCMSCSKKDKQARLTPPIHTPN